jgi:hypothetical protein
MPNIAALQTESNQPSRQTYNRASGANRYTTGSERRRHQEIVSARLDARRAVFADHELPRGAHDLYFVLDDISGNRGIVYDRPERIAARAGMSRRSFFRYLKLLKAKHYVGSKRQDGRARYVLRAVLLKCQFDAPEVPPLKCQSGPSKVPELALPTSIEPGNTGPGCITADAEIPDGDTTDIPFSERFRSACRYCKGTGRIRADRCGACRGDGLTYEGRRAGKKEPYA